MIIPKSYGVKICGIYCITNTNNNKQYIGSSKNIYHRLKRHQSELKRGIHSNKHLLNSYVKHGEKVFSVSILKEVNEDFLAITEQYYIDSLKPAYNITSEVIRNTPSKESRKKISETLKKQKAMGILKYPTHDHLKQPIVIYDINCNLIGSFDSQRAAAKQLQELYPNLNNAQSILNSAVNLRGGRKTKRYKQHYLLPPCESCNTEKTFRKDGIKVRVVDIISNSEFMFPTLMEASKILGCNESSVKRALVNSRLLLKQFKVSYYE